MIDLLKKIAFPIFLVGKEEPSFDDGVAFYYYIKQVVEGDDVHKILVLDDKKAKGDTLARRRLELKKNGVPLKKLKRAIFFFHDMVKASKGATWFIDSNGLVFKYKKTVRLPIEYRLIKKVVHSDQGVHIIEVQGVPTRFKVLYAPKHTEKYAGVLRMDGGFILYCLSEDQKPTSWKMI
jgi:hypothetical protein